MCMGDEGAKNLPVTNLKGLVSRSSSDMFAIVSVRLSGEGGRSWGGVNWEWDDLRLSSRELRQSH